jgi:hypothetical protein
LRRENPSEETKKFTLFEYCATALPLLAIQETNPIAAFTKCPLDFSQYQSMVKFACRNRSKTKFLRRL